MTVYYNDKTIGQFTIGRVVRYVKGAHTGSIGHVKGFTVNEHGELVVSVALASHNEKYFLISPDNLEAL